MSKLDLEKQNFQDFADVLKQPAGARFIAGLVAFCGVFDNMPDGSAREVGLTLYRWALDVDGGEEAYIKGRDDCKRILERGKK